MSASPSPAEEVGQASSENVLKMLKTLMRGNTKEDTKKRLVTDLLKIFRLYPSLINCRYKIKKGEDHTPLMCFLLNTVSLASIEELIQISPDPDTTTSMNSGGRIPVIFACKSNRGDLITLLATANPKLVSSLIMERFFLLNNNNNNNNNFPACSVEMLQNLLVINPTATVSDHFLNRSFTYGGIPLNLLEKLIENCKEFGYSRIILHEDITQSLKGIQVSCKILCKICHGTSNYTKIEPTNLHQWDCVESFLHLLQELESNAPRIRRLKIWVPDIIIGDHWDETIDGSSSSTNSLISNAMIKMITNNKNLWDLVLYCSSDVKSIHFWLETALKALPTANKSLTSLKVSNDQGFYVLTKAAAAAAATTTTIATTTTCKTEGVKLQPPMLTSPTTVCLPTKYLINNDDNMLLRFVEEKLYSMCSIQCLQIGCGGGSSDNNGNDYCSSSKGTTTRIVTALLRNSSTLKIIRFGEIRKGSSGFRIDLIGIAKALQDNTTLQELDWLHCNQKITQDDLKAFRNVLRNHNVTLMKFNIWQNNEYLIDPQISYYVDLNWRGRSKVGQIINHGAIEELIDILTCLKNSSVRDQTKKLGIWYGLLREAPAVWSNNNNNLPRHGGHGKDLKHSSSRKRKHGETV